MLEDVSILRANATSLGIARSLAKENILPCVLDSSFIGWGKKSNCIKEISLNTNNLILELINSGKEKKRVLYLSEDKDVLLISKNRKLLEKYYFLNIPAYDIAEKFINKNIFYKLMERDGNPVAESKYFSNLNDLLANKLTLNDFPVFLKVFLEKAVYIEDEKELEERIKVIKDKNKPVALQKIIRGPISNIYFVFCYFDKKGNCLASFSGRKIRQYPHFSGNTTYGKSHFSHELVEKTIEIFNKYGVTGFCSMEYKYDDDKKQFIIIEPTIGRFNLQIMLSTMSHVNFPHIMHQDLFCNSSGKRNALDIQKDNIYWMNEFQDFLTVKNPLNSISFLKWFKQLIRANALVIIDKKDLTTVYHSLLYYVKEKFKSYLVI